MELFYYKDPLLNFGDDLNAVLWPAVLPQAILDAPDLVLIGIGSILSEEWVGKYSNSSRSVIVLGTGTSYDLPPKNMQGWSILAVRGPLTAELIGKPEASATDGAILLADAPNLIGPAQSRDNIVFMPHHRSVRHSPWHQIADAAGMRYVSPQQPVERILTEFATAKLVVTEAMHGAIIADTLRIPWVPVIISPGIDEFKWRDWCLSMEAPFTPQHITSGHAADVRHYSAMRGILLRAGLSGHAILEERRTKTELEDYFERRFSKATKSALLHPLPTGRASRLRAHLLQLANHLYRAEAIRSLRAAGQREGFLSKDHIFRARLDQMREAVSRAEKIALGGPR